MKTIAFYNNKGGIGKTASVTTIAHMMATEFNKRVLIVDLDPQGNTSSMYSETDFFELFSRVWNQTSEKDNYSVEDLLLNERLDPHKCIQKTEWTNLDIIPAYMTLSEAEEIMKSKGVLSPQHYNLYEQLKKIESEYDFCLIDCSPSRGLLNSNGLLACDEVYIPTRCDGGSLLGIALTMDFLTTEQKHKKGDKELKLGGCFFTQFRGNKNIEKEVYKLIQSVFPKKDQLIPITIRTSKLVEECTLEQTPLLAIDPKMKNEVTKEYYRLTDYIINR